MAFFERGRSPYIRFIRKNLTFLNSVIQNGDWERLRRHPPCVMPDPQGEAHLIELALQRVEVERDLAAQPGVEVLERDRACVRELQRRERGEVRGGRAAMADAREVGVEVGGAHAR